MKVVAIVQARLGLTRLPRKVLKPLGAHSLIGVLLQRLSRSNEIDQVIVATSATPFSPTLALASMQGNIHCDHRSALFPLPSK